MCSSVIEYLPSIHWILHSILSRTKVSGVTKNFKRLTVDILSSSVEVLWQKRDTFYLSLWDVLKFYFQVQNFVSSCWKLETCSVSLYQLVIRSLQGGWFSVSCERWMKASGRASARLRPQNAIPHAVLFSGRAISTTSLLFSVTNL